MPRSADLGGSQVTAQLAGGLALCLGKIGTDGPLGVVIARPIQHLASDKHRDQAKK